MHHTAFGYLKSAGLAALLSSVCAPLGAQQPSTLVLPDKDAQLQAELTNVLNLPSYKRLVQQGRLSVALVDGSLQFGDLRGLLRVPDEAPSFLQLPTARVTVTRAPRTTRVSPTVSTWL